MAKIEREGLLNKKISDCFDGAEISYLAQLLDNEIMDWTADRRRPYEHLLEDLNFLANALLSTGRDLGRREETWWADSIEDKPKNVMIHVICTCGKRLDVTLSKDGEYLKQWSVWCKLHNGHPKRELGTVNITGSPGMPINAQLVIQNILVNYEQQLNRDPEFKFSVDAKF
jgi:hypothetical protein